MKRFLVFLLLIISVSLISCSKQIPPKTFFVMNTVCTINLFEDGTAELYEILFNRLRELELVFDVNNPNSEISRVNESAGEASTNSPYIEKSVPNSMPVGENDLQRGIPVSEDFSNVMKVALDLAEFTDGAFNPACGPLVKLWGVNTDHAKVPTPEEIEETLPLCDYHNVIFRTAPNSLSVGKPASNTLSDDENDFSFSNTIANKESAQNILSAEETIFTVEFSVSGVSLDLGGIAKGYAADELVSILREHNVKRAIIDLGGNIYVFGQKKDKSPWKVGIKNPLDPSTAPKLILDCEETSIVTSGIYERFFEQDGKRYHHILDCKTGYPVDNGIASVTIECKSSLWADVLSTALFVLGRERIEQMDFGKFAPEFEYIIITDDGEITRGGF